MAVLGRINLIALASALTLAHPCWATDQNKRFVEFPDAVSTVTYDLDTVNLLQPGRFSIIETTIDNPDVMRFELRVLGALGTYCTRTDGLYPAPGDVLTLGPADMPIHSIKVETVQPKGYGKSERIKWVSWDYPYRRFAIDTTEGLMEKPSRQFGCGDKGRRAYNEEYSLITNGSRSKYLYDCKRGIQGLYFDEQDEKPSLTAPIKKDTFAYEYYVSLCLHVTNEPPYEPN